MAETPRVLAFRRRPPTPRPLVKRPFVHRQRVLPKILFVGCIMYTALGLLFTISLLALDDMSGQSVIQMLVGTALFSFGAAAAMVMLDPDTTSRDMENVSRIMRSWARRVRLAWFDPGVRFLRAFMRKERKVLPFQRPQQR